MIIVFSDTFVHNFPINKKFQLSIAQSPIPNSKSINIDGLIIKCAEKDVYEIFDRIVNSFICNDNYIDLRNFIDTDGDCYFLKSEE